MVVNPAVDAGEYVGAEQQIPVVRHNVCKPRRIAGATEGVDNCARPRIETEAQRQVLRRLQLELIGATLATEGATELAGVVVGAQCNGGVLDLDRPDVTGVAGGPRLAALIGRQTAAAVFVRIAIETRQVGQRWPAIIDQRPEVGGAVRDVAASAETARAITVEIEAE
jgi:hypothetical protein